jgi:sugar phosphate isomerase/epimerase
VSDAGYKNVELYYDPRPAWVQETILQSLDDFNLRPYSLHLPKFIFFFEEPEFSSSVEAVFPFIEKAGVEVAVLHLPSKKQIKRGIWKPYFDTLLENAEKVGCVLGLENIPYLPDAHLFIRDLLDTHSSKHLGVTIDLEYMHLHGTPMQSLMDVFGQHVENVHFRDSDGDLVDAEGKRKYLNPGKGDIDFDEVMKTLTDYGYEKAITVEVSHRQRENIIRAKEFVETCLEKIGNLKLLD